MDRVIGTIRRECLDHVIVFNERSLYRHLRDFIEYYHRTRTHLGLQKDTPEFRPVQSTEAGRTFRFRRSADFIIVTSGAPPKPPHFKFSPSPRQQYAIPGKGGCVPTTVLIPNKPARRTLEAQQGMREQQGHSPIQPKSTDLPKLLAD